MNPFGSCAAILSPLMRLVPIAIRCGWRERAGSCCESLDARPLQAALRLAAVHAGVRRAKDFQDVLALIDMGADASLGNHHPLRMAARACDELAFDRLSAMASGPLPLSAILDAHAWTLDEFHRGPARAAIRAKIAAMRRGEEDVRGVAARAEALAERSESLADQYEAQLARLEAWNLSTWIVDHARLASAEGGAEPDELADRFAAIAADLYARSKAFSVATGSYFNH